MAALSNDGPKKWRIVYESENGTRKPFRFSGFNKRDAEVFHNLFERLLIARSLGTKIDVHDLEILDRLQPSILKRLEKHGVIPPKEEAPEPGTEEPEPMLLADFIQDHVDAGRTSKGKPAAENTLANWRSTQRFLEEQFPDRELDSITLEDAHQFRRWMDKRKIKQKTSARNGEPMSENAKRKHIANCKMFFNAARRRGLVQVNAFDEQVSETESNRSRDHFITIEDTQRLLEKAPDVQWRLMIALWRLAGLRKMEVFSLTWGDVLWNDGKLRVHPPKTKQHESCDIRYVPLRDVWEQLEEAFQAALPGARKSLPADRPVIDRFASSNSNLDKPFRKIVEAAGLVPWAKAFQNLRSSCETQWIQDGERPDLVANWIGHSVKVQRKNYLQHTQADVENFNSQAAILARSESGTKSGTVTARTDENASEFDGTTVVAKPAQKRHKPAKTLGKSHLFNTPGGT